MSGTQRKRRGPAAEDLRALIGDELRAILRPTLPAVPWRELVGGFLASRTAADSSPRTMSMYANLFEKFQETTGIQSSDDLTPGIVEGYVLKRRGEPGRLGATISPRTLNVTIRTVKALSRWAFERGLLAEDRLRKVRQIPVDSKPVEHWSEEQVNRIVSRLSPATKPLVLTAIMAGLRKGEIAGLTWEDIDFKDRLILVVGQRRADAQRAKSRRERLVPICPPLLEVLAALPRTSIYVFPGRDGGKRSPTTCSANRALREAARRAGVKGRAFLHKGRASYGSILRAAGVDLELIADLMGHSTSKVTKEHYAALRTEHLHEPAARLAARLGYEPAPAPDEPAAMAAAVAPLDPGATAIRLWWAAFGPRPANVPGLFGIMARTGLVRDLVGDGNDREVRSRLGQWIHARRDERVDAFRIVQLAPAQHGRAAVYRLELVEASDPDPLRALVEEARRAIQPASEPEPVVVDPWAALFDGWWTTHQGAVLESADVFDLAVSEGLLEELVGTRGERSARVALGYGMTARIGLVIGGYRLVDLGRSHARRHDWRLVRVGRVEDVEASNGDE